MDPVPIPQPDALDEAREILAVVESLNAVEDLQELLDRLAEATALVAGWRTSVLSVYLPEGALLGSHNLPDDERSLFLRSMERTPFERRAAKRAQIRAHAFPGTAIAYVPWTDGLARSAAFCPSRPLGVPGTWHPEDRLFILVRTGTGQEIGVLSLDEPIDGNAPSLETLGPLRLVERLLELGASFLHGRVMARDLKRREESYRALVEQAPVGIYRRTKEGHLLSVNPRLVEIFGYPSREALLADDAFTALCDPGDRRAILALLARHGEARDFDMRARRIDGTPIRLRLTVRSEPDGQVQGIVEDVTESRRLEEQIQRTQRIEAVGTLASGIAHDFNNLLAGVLGYSSLLEQQLVGNDDLRGMARAIQDAAQRAADLTRGLLGVTRPSTGEAARADPTLVLGDCARLARETFDRRITTEVDVAPGTPAARVAPGDLHRAILNLCINARDAMPEGGRLLLSAVRDAVGPKAPPEDSRGGPWVRVEVRDTGVGMDDAVRARIFEPFFTTKPRGKGTGLGLYGCYQMLHAAGGAVEVDSRPGGGACFRLFLPVAPDVASVEGACAGPVAGTAPRARILLVEDEESVRRLARRILVGAGHTVEDARDGEEAVARFAADPSAFDLLLLDLVLPRMAGAEVLRRCLALRKDLRVLLSSGNVHEGLDDPAVRAGVAGVLPKPYLPTELLEAVNRALLRPAVHGLGMRAPA